MKKPDPICRWQNPFLDNVKKLTEYLPKQIMQSKTARELTNKNYGSDFFGTPYQLACQLGLYYESNGYYYPRFNHSPSKLELFSYMENWITKYYTPNPYTKSFSRIEKFKDLKPFSIHSKLCEKLFISKSELKWPEVLLEIYPGAIKNIDILKNALSYSKVLAISKEKVSLKESLNYDILLEYVFDIPQDDIHDKQFFFLYLNNNYHRNKDSLSPIFSELEGCSKLEIETVRDAIAKVRLGQSKFRSDLLNSKKNSCVFTNIYSPESLLIAGHIKPWSKSSNIERLDINNGILLTPTFDKLFDSFKISFDENGKLIYSSKINEDTWKELFPKFEDIKNTEIEITAENKSYFDFHRNKFNEENK